MIVRVGYMTSLLDIKVLSERMRIHVEEMIAMKELPKESYSRLREALLIGEFARGKAQEITGLKDRAARGVLYALVEKGLLVSDTPRVLIFPVSAVVLERIEEYR
jgi:Fic family protein